MPLSLDGTGSITGIGTFNFSDEIVHVGDTNTKIRFPAADTITAETAGTERLRITSNGRVGVNQSTWASKDHMFEVRQDTNDKEIARFTVNAGSGSVQGKGFIGLSAFNATTYPHAYIGVEEYGTSHYQGHLIFATRNASNDSVPTERLRITSAGKVGVNTDGPSQQFTSYAASGYPILANGPSNGIGLGGNGVIVFGNKDVASYGSGAIDASDFAIKISGNEKLRIDSSGRLLIGTTTEGYSPDAQTLTIAESGNSGMTIRSGASSAGHIYFSDATSGAGEYVGQIGYNHSSNYLLFATNSAERLRIDSSGRVLIGTTTEGSGGADELTIATSGDTGMTIRSGTSSAGGIYFSDGTSGGDEYRGVLSYNHANNYMRFYTDGTEKMRLDTNGSLRILDFSTAVDSGADDFVVGTTNSGINRGMTILSHTGADARICFATASDPDEGMIKYSHGSDVMQFFVNAAERMRIENLGDAEWGMKFLNSKAIEFKDQGINICSLTWSISASTWTNFFSHQTYFQGWVFLNGTHNAGNSSALWSISKSPSGGSTANRFAHDNSYSPASINMRVNGLWTQINSSYATYGYAVLISLAGGNNVANLSG